MKKLTKQELLKTELYNERKKSRDLELKVMELQTQISILQFEIRKKEHESNIRLRKEALDNKKDKNEIDNREHQKFNEKLKDKYKIKESFGINPDTGEILES